MITTTLPDHDTLMARLMALDNNPHLVEHFYPLVSRAAGRELAGEGIVVWLTQAVADYTHGMPDIMATLMHMRLWQFVLALTDDSAVREAGLQLLASAGLPAGPAREAAE